MLKTANYFRAHGQHPQFIENSLDIDGVSRFDLFPMQADGLVVEIVKRFAERLRQIKDIMELKGSTRPQWSSPPWLTDITLLINEKDNSTT